MNVQQSRPDPGPATVWEPRTLASDADRDHAADLLNAAAAEGRLTADEHGERVRAAYAARTWQELCRLTADVPAWDRGASGGTAAPEMVANLDPCLLCLLLVLCPPAGIWLLLSRRRSHAYLDQPPIRADGPSSAVTRPVTAAAPYLLAVTPRT